MTRNAFALALATGLLALSGCNQTDQSETAKEGAEAVKQAGDKTIAAGLDQKGRFFTLAKAAGLDATLAGPGPYTVFVADDAAFDKLPAGTVETWMKPEARPDLTRTLIVPDPAGDRPGRGHRQGDRCRQRQGTAGDDGRRYADRHP